MNIFRIIRFAFQDLFRNISLSVMTVLILVLMLLSVNTLLVIRVLTDEATRVIKDQIDISIYFHQDSTQEQIDEVQSYINAFPEVTSITFHTKEEVYEEFRTQHADNPEIIASLEELEDNPLGPTMVVKTRDTGDYQKIITALSVPEYESIIEAKTFDDTQQAIARVHTITSQVERFSVMLTAFFAVIAFLIIFNTIRVAIYTQRIEISIKKLVGATNWFVRGPYIVEAFIFSALSIVFTFGVAIASSQFLDQYIEVLFGKVGFLTNYFYSNILELVAVQFAAVFILTILSSMLAMRRYLRV